jgi:hypothetical protein
MLDDILKKVEAAYNCCPAYTGGNDMEKPCFERQDNFLIAFKFIYSFIICKSDRVLFSITKGSTAQSIDESYLHGTVAELFGHAKSKSLLSESDAKSLKIPLRLFVYPESSTHVEVLVVVHTVTFDLI